MSAIKNVVLANKTASKKVYYFFSNFHSLLAVVIMFIILVVNTFQEFALVSSNEENTQQYIIKIQKESEVYAKNIVLHKKLQDENYFRLKNSIDLNIIKVQVKNAFEVFNKFKILTARVLEVKLSDEYFNVVTVEVATKSLKNIKEKSLILGEASKSMLNASEIIYTPIGIKFKIVKDTNG